MEIILSSIYAWLTNFLKELVGGLTVLTFLGEFIIKFAAVGNCENEDTDQKFQKCWERTISGPLSRLPGIEFLLVLNFMGESLVNSISTIALLNLEIIKTQLKIYE